MSVRIFYMLAGYYSDIDDILLVSPREQYKLHELHLFSSPILSLFAALFCGFTTIFFIPFLGNLRMMDMHKCALPFAFVWHIIVLS